MSILRWPGWGTWPSGSITPRLVTKARLKAAARAQPSQRHHLCPQHLPRNLGDFGGGDAEQASTVIHTWASARCRENPKISRNRLNGLQSKHRLITWLKPGVNKKIRSRPGLGAA